MSYKACFNCEKRHPGCHGECENYLKAKEARERGRKEAQKNHIAKSFLSDSFHKAQKRANRK